MTIQVTQGSAVLPNLQRARATALHGSYRFDPCAAGNVDRGKGLFGCVSAVCNKTVATGTWFRYSVPHLRVADVHHRLQLSLNSAVLPGGMIICFQSVTECDADICKNLQVNVEFPGGITIDFLTMPRTISMPQIGGLVQRREVTSVGLESLLDNDGLIVGSVSPRPTYFGRYSFDYRLLGEASSTDQCTGGTLVRGGVSLQTFGHLFTT